MTPILIGQLLGIGIACGLNLYATVAALGLLSRLGLIRDLPVGLQGLEGVIVIGSALALYLVEAIIDKLRHFDSLWDTVHTFIRPPAAALLAVGALWTGPLELQIAGAVLALVVALLAHAVKAGFRLSLNASTPSPGPLWISVAEDLAAIVFAVAAVQAPRAALVAGGIALVLMLAVGPRFFRAFTLGLRCLAAWFRALFARSRWREAAELPRDIRKLVADTPMGIAPPRGTLAAVRGVPGVADYRSGWLMVTRQGPLFLYRTLLGARAAVLPPVLGPQIERGLWADMIRVAGSDQEYTLYLLKDGPPLEAAVSDLTLYDPNPELRSK